MAHNIIRTHPNPKPFFITRSSRELDGVRSGRQVRSFDQIPEQLASEKESHELGELLGHYEQLTREFDRQDDGHSDWNHTEAGVTVLRTKYIQGTKVGKELDAESTLGPAEETRFMTSGNMVAALERYPSNSRVTLFTLPKDENEAVKVRQERDLGAASDSKLLEEAGFQADSEIGERLASDLPEPNSEPKIHVDKNQLKLPADSRDARNPAEVPSRNRTETQVRMANTALGDFQGVARVIERSDNRRSDLNHVDPGVSFFSDSVVTEAVGYTVQVGNMGRRNAPKLATYTGVAVNTGTTLHLDLQREDDKRYISNGNHSTLIRGTNERGFEITQVNFHNNGQQASIRTEKSEDWAGSAIIADLGLSERERAGTQLAERIPELMLERRAYDAKAKGSKVETDTAKTEEQPELSWKEKLVSRLRRS